MGAQSYTKAGADATNSAITTYAQGMTERAQMKATQNENERLNKLQWTAMGNRINTVNLQRGLLRQQTGTDLYNIRKEANRAGATSLNNAAAAGIEGASVDEAAGDIQRQSQEAQAKTRDNELIQEINLDTQIDDITTAAANAQRYSQKPTTRGEVIGRAWGTSTMQFFSSLAGSSFDYTPTSGNQWSQGGGQATNVQSSGTQTTAAAQQSGGTSMAGSTNYSAYNFNQDYSTNFSLNTDADGRYVGYGQGSDYSFFGS